MKKIIITGGRYGYISPSGVHSVKTTDSPPFEVEDKEAARLVKLGVAKIHGEGGKRPENEPLPSEEGNAPTDDENGAESENEGNTSEPPEYNANSPVGELRAIAKNVGISFKVGTTKEGMVAALDEYFNGDDENNDGSGEFALKAADPVG